MKAFKVFIKPLKSPQRSVKIKIQVNFFPHFRLTFQTNKTKEISEDINPFLVNVPILYPLKTIENQNFSGFFKGYKIGTLARNGLKKTEHSYFPISDNEKKLS